MGIENLGIAAGRFFTDNENESAQLLAFIGAEVADNLFSSRAVVGQELKISGIPYRVIGVARATGAVFGVPQDAFITVPLKTYAKDFGAPGRRRAIYFNATAKSDKSFTDAVEEAAVDAAPSCFFRSQAFRLA